MTFARKNKDMLVIQETLQDLVRTRPDIAHRVLLPSDDVIHVIHHLIQDVCEVNALPAYNTEGAPTSGIVGLVLALNSCVHVSAYGFILSNDASYYDDKQATMWGGWRGDGVVNLWDWASADAKPHKPQTSKQATAEPEFFHARDDFTKSYHNFALDRLVQKRLESEGIVFR